MFKAFGVDLPSTGTVFEREDGDRLAAARRRASRCWPRSRRLGARPACRRSRPCARAPCCRRRGSPESRTAAPIVLGIAAVALALGLFGERLPTGAVAAAGRGRVHPAVHRRRHDLLAPGAAARGRRGRTGERLGGAPGALAKDNATRNPSRTARTAGALMIGLALVTLVATLGASLKGTTRTRSRIRCERTTS